VSFVRKEDRVQLCDRSQLSRVRGEGSRVSVRGLGAGFNSYNKSTI